MSEIPIPEEILKAQGIETGDPEGPEMPKVSQSDEADALPANMEMAQEGKQISAKIVDNPELGIRYKETVIELPKHRQEEYGIKRIRKRELMPPLPAGLFRDDDQEIVREYYNDWAKKDLRREVNLRTGPRYELTPKFYKIYEFLTDGSFPSVETAGHMFSGTALYNNNPEFQKSGLEHVEKLKKEGLMFQKIVTGIKGTVATPEENTAYFSRSNEGSLVNLRSKSNSESDFSVFKLSVWNSTQTWKPFLKAPLFLFGRKNAAYRRYLQSILENPETQEMLEASNFSDEPITSFTTPDSDNYHSAFEHIYGPFGKESKDVEGMKRQEASSRKNNLAIPVWVPVKGQGNLDLFRLLVKNDRPYASSVAHIPVVKHPAIKPMRWCHSDCAVVPTKRSLNVLFFESDDAPEQAAFKER